MYVKTILEGDATDVLSTSATRNRMTYDITSPTKYDVDVNRSFLPRDTSFVHSTSPYKQRDKENKISKDIK